MNVPLPLPVDELKCFVGPGGFETIGMPGEDYFSKAALLAYGQACAAAALSQPAALGLSQAFVTRVTAPGADDISVIGTDRSSLPTQPPQPVSQEVLEVLERACRLLDSTGLYSESDRHRVACHETRDSLRNFIKGAGQ